MSKKILEIKDLSVELNHNKIINDITFSVEEGEILGVVGESGSGKTMTALTILGLLPKDAKVMGSIKYYEKDLIKMNKEERRKINGKHMGMVFQEPMTSLNPLLKIGYQVEETLKIHNINKNEELKEKAINILTEVGLRNPLEVYDKYPHQLSGGMRQRAVIAMAMIANPRVLIADEPTTALDKAIQVQILKLIKKINKDNKTTVIFISHDLRIVKNLCDRILIMNKGSIVEMDKTHQVFSNPKDNYTRKLLNSTFSRDVRLKGYTDFAYNKTLIELNNVNVYYREKSGLKKVVNSVSLTLKEGEILGIVGESGSGKTTLCKAILGLIRDVEGNLDLHGNKPQMVFQDPFSSLNPKRNINWILEEPMKIKGKYSGAQRKEMINSMLLEVGLTKEYGIRYPKELSGGQRQRVCIGTSLIVNPKIVILDEPVSALDVTVGAKILKLLLELRDKFNLSYIFVSHDLDIIRQMCDVVAVMYQGNIVESDTTEEIFNNPKHEYTKKLLDRLTF